MASEIAPLTKVEPVLLNKQSQPLTMQTYRAPSIPISESPPLSDIVTPQPSPPIDRSTKPKEVEQPESLLIPDIKDKGKKTSFFEMWDIGNLIFFMIVFFVMAVCLVMDYAVWEKTLKDQNKRTSGDNILTARLWMGWLGIISLLLYTAIASCETTEGFSMFAYIIAMIFWGLFILFTSLRTSYLLENAKFTYILTMFLAVGVILSFSTGLVGCFKFIF